MTALERVKSTRRILGAGAVIQALGWGIAVALGMLAVFSFATLGLPGLAVNPGWSWMAVGAGVAVSAMLAWRSRHIRSVGRVALWLEETVPALEYALVTAVERSDARGISAEADAGIEAAVARQRLSVTTRTAFGRTIGPGIAAAIVAALLLYVSPSAAFGGGGLFPGAPFGAPAGSENEASRLEDLGVQVIPPQYSGERRIVLTDPSSIPALVGSRIIIRGEGGPDGVTGTVGSSALGVAALRGGWSASLVMPAKPAALTLRDRDFERIIVLEPRTDNPPRIVLTSPARDSTLRAARLTLRLEASATDDIGLGAGYFEYLITTGSGEIFSARTLTTPVVQFNGARRGNLAARLDLATLNLNQGDVVSIRAITQDVNTLSGPGLATSDTRTYRIARADEYDSVSVDAAGPLPIDSSAMSQRMLIQMTEQLLKEQSRLTRDEFVRRATNIGDLEDRIRRRVHEILYDQEGGAGSEEPEHGASADVDAHDHSDEAVPAHNSDLLEAYNALWEAVRSLQIAEPEPALPPMRVALRALDRVRLANRLYLRGLQPTVIVDIERVRMTGKEKGSASVRTPVTRADSVRARLDGGFAAAIELVQSRPADAVRALTLLQVDALSVAPGFASAVGEAIEAVRRGRDATLPLLRARRSLMGDPTGRPGLPAWSGDG
ncbi:MAG: hypothetical protein ACR2GK_08975 [Gemmatimonadaceae bacterium]